MAVVWWFCAVLVTDSINGDCLKVAGMLVSLVGIFVVLVALFLGRSTYRLLAPHNIDGDAYDFLLQIEDIRKAGHRRPDKPSQVVTSGVYAYPYFLLWVLSFLPEPALERVERYFSGISDLVFAGLILSLVPLDILTVQQTLPGLVVFLFSPQFMRPNFSHANGLSGRKPGLFLASASLLGLVLATIGGELAFFAVAIVVAAAMMLTSKFSLQAWFFVVLGFGVLVDPLALVVIPAALVLAVVGSRGRYWHILRGHLSHVQDYAKTKQYKRFDHSFPNPIRWALALLRADTWRDRMEIVYETRWLRILVDTPYIPVTILVYGLAVREGVSLGVPLGIHVWMGILIACFVLISMPHLLFLGEAERYLEYALLPAVVLIGTGFQAFPTMVLALVAVAAGAGLVVQGVYVWAYRNIFYEPDRQQQGDEVLDALCDLDTGVVLVQPAFFARTIAYETPHKVVERLGGNSQSTERASREINRLFPETYDFVTDDIAWLEETYSPDWVVIDREKLAEEAPDGRLSEAPGLAPPEDLPIWENDQFAIYPFKAFTQQ